MKHKTNNISFSVTARRSYVVVVGVVVVVIDAFSP